MKRTLLAAGAALLALPAASQEAGYVIAEGELVGSFRRE